MCPCGNEVVHPDGRAEQFDDARPTVLPADGWSYTGPFLSSQKPLCEEQSVPTHPLENPSRERDLADQEGERDAERYPNQRGQGEFEQRLKVNPTYGERQQNDDGNMDDVHGKGLLG